MTRQISGRTSGMERRYAVRLLSRSLCTDVKGADGSPLLIVANRVVFILRDA